MSFSGVFNGQLMTRDYAEMQKQFRESRKPQLLRESKRQDGTTDKKKLAALEMQESMNTILAESKKWGPWVKDLKGPLKGFTARILEHQDAFLQSLDETTKVIQIGNFDKFAFPLIRAIFPNLIANEIVSVD